MNNSFQWPLTAAAARQITPGPMLAYLQQNPISQGCYPIAFGYYPDAVGHQMQRDNHQDNLLIYCDRGRGTLTTEHFTGEIKTGDVIILPTGHAHQYQASLDDPWTIYWLHFDGSQAQKLIDALDFSPQQVVSSIGQQPLLASDFNRLLSLKQHGYHPNVFNYAAALTRQILVFLAYQIRFNPPSKGHNFNLDALRSLMLEHIDGELDLNTLAASTQLSRHHFAAKYKNLTGISPIKHFIHLKMERACYLLDSSHQSVKQVAAALGYSDPLYFSRIFKKVIGLSPSDYRNKLRV